jgi:hypothetical protein
LQPIKYPDWQESYHSALLETDRSKLRQKLFDAEAAIFRRRVQLLNTAVQDRGSARDELLALNNALSSLAVLRKELKEEP